MENNREPRSQFTCLKPTAFDKCAKHMDGKSPFVSLSDDRILGSHIAKRQNQTPNS